MKYRATCHGERWEDYDTLEDLLKDEYMFKNLYSMASFTIEKVESLNEEEERIIDARSWEIRNWGFHPDPRSSKQGE